jgi:hypothetical protein
VVETAVAISRIFDRDAERAKINHEISMRGGPRIQTNHFGLHGDSRSWFRTLTDWLK